METSPREPIIIELDDPTPRWYRYGGFAIAIVVVALLLAPWLIDIDRADDLKPSGTQQVQASGYAPVCQPTLDLPSFAEPAASVALPSWMRICDWFAEPGGQPVAWPTEPANSSQFLD
jgi:hypothetical protein